jgi:hypothetical protein
MWEITYTIKVRAPDNFQVQRVIILSSDRIVKGIIDDIINTAVKTAEVNEQKIIFTTFY